MPRLFGLGPIRSRASRRQRRDWTGSQVGSSTTGSWGGGRQGLQLGQALLIEGLQGRVALDRLAVIAVASQGRERGPFGSELGGKLRGELSAISQSEGTAALNQKDGGLVLNMGAKPSQAQFLAGHGPSEGHELVSPGGGAGIATGIDHPVRMAIHSAHQATAKHHAVAQILTAGPGAFGEANRVQQGAALRRDRVAEGPAWSDLTIAGIQHRQARTGRGGLARDRRKRRQQAEGLSIGGLRLGLTGIGQGGHGGQQSRDTQQGCNREGEERTRSARRSHRLRGDLSGQTIKSREQRTSRGP